MIENRKRKRKPYRVWTAAGRAEIGKPAFDKGNTTAVRLLSHKYAGLIKQAVSDFKKEYTELNEKNKNNKNNNVETIVKKKTG